MADSRDTFIMKGIERIVNMSKKLKVSGNPVRMAVETLDVIQAVFMALYRQDPKKAVQYHDRLIYGLLLPRALMTGIDGAESVYVDGSTPAVYVSVPARGVRG